MCLDGLRKWKLCQSPFIYVSLARMEKRGRNQFFLPRHTAKLSILPSLFGTCHIYLGPQIRHISSQKQTICVVRRPVVCNSIMFEHISCQDSQKRQISQAFLMLLWISMILGSKLQKLPFYSKNHKVHLRIFQFYGFFRHIFMAALQGEGDEGEMDFSGTC